MSPQTDGQYTSETFGTPEGGTCPQKREEGVRQAVSGVCDTRQSRPS